MQSASYIPAYTPIATEYYDSELHPTCAAFRKITKAYLKLIWIENELANLKVCDIGAGKSLIGELRAEGLIKPKLLHFLDQSEEMLELSKEFSNSQFDLYHMSAEEISYTNTKYDLITALLGDPYNTSNVWTAVYESLKLSGELIFITPSWEWACHFRSFNPFEKGDAARFVLADGREIFVPSIIRKREEQIEIFKDVGFIDINYQDVPLSLLDFPPPKLNFLCSEQPVLTCYFARKLVES